MKLNCDEPLVWRCLNTHASEFIRPEQIPPGGHKYIGSLQDGRFVPVYSFECRCGFSGWLMQSFVGYCPKCQTPLMTPMQENGYYVNPD